MINFSFYWSHVQVFLDSRFGVPVVREESFAYIIMPVGSSFFFLHQRPLRVCSASTPPFQCVVGFIYVSIPMRGGYGVGSPALILILSSIMR